MKKITLAEQKEIQLKMLQEIDAFCREHSIKYSLAFGTLLGAVRHHGYIPWDDDVDLLMPLPDMIRFKNEFVSDSLKYCDADTEKHFEFPFSRIANVMTYNKRGIIAKSYGICIDLYPVISVPKLEEERKSFFSQAELLVQKRLSYLKWNARAIRYFPVYSIPGFDRFVKRYRDFMLNEELYGKTGVYYIVAGPLSHQKQDTYYIDLFEELIELDFEGFKFLSTAHFDTYLSQSYGDYMQLPPEDQRNPYHGGNYYWK